MRVATILLVTSAFGCSSPPGDGAGAGDDSGGGGLECLTCSDASIDVSAFVQVKGELTQVCANADGCHGAGAGMLGLSAGNVFGPLVGVASYEMPSLLRVKPFDPAQSYVYMKLACEGGIQGSCMPLGGSITPGLLRAFHDWIEAGAPTQ